ncbi:MAG: hypothetical protein Q9212_001001 [Teloschistes hypoglaucus]
MVSGEYESMKALHSISPDLTPEPIAWGTFAQADHVHFFLCEFIDMTDDLPAVEPTMKMLAELHAKSSSPNVELAPLRPVRHGIGEEYIEAYFKNFEISPPTEDQDDRNALYYLRWDMNCSALYPGNLRYRKIHIEVMKYLTEQIYRWI